MAQPTNGMDGIEAVQHHNYPEVVPPPEGAPKEVYAYGQQQAFAPPAAPEKRICGLRRTTFFLLALLLVVVIAAAVGGGVGGSLATQQAYDRGRREEAAAQATTQDDDSESGSRIKAPPTKGLVELDCPGINGETKSVEIAGTLYEFRANCGIDRPSGAGGKDITRFPAYSVDDCITACAAFNEMDSVKVECVAAHFNANLFTEDGGNCWLKSALGDKKVNDDADEKNNMITLDKV